MFSPFAVELVTTGIYEGVVTQANEITHEITYQAQE